MLFIYINTAVKMFKESQKHLKYNSELDNHFICATHWRIYTIKLRCF
jgi:hypothetical protein